MEIFQRILSLSLALLILVSTSSFVVNMHFCGGAIQELSFKAILESCQMDTPAATNSHCETIEQEEDSCCADHSVVNETQDFNNHSHQVQELKPDFKIISFVACFVLAVLEPVDQSILSHQDYSPPLIERNIPVLVQSFLL